MLINAVGISSHPASSWLAIIADISCCHIIWFHQFPHFSVCTMCYYCVPKLNIALQAADDSLRTEAGYQAMCVGCTKEEFDRHHRIRPVEQDMQFMLQFSPLAGTNSLGWRFWRLLWNGFWCNIATIYRLTDLRHLFCYAMHLCSVCDVPHYLF